MKGIKQVAKKLNARFENAITGRLAGRWRQADGSLVAAHSDFIRQQYLRRGDYWDTPGGQADLQQLTIGRLETDRRTYVPWINSVLPLPGADILEVGAGTGSSTVALAEQGAKVTGVDLLDDGILVAREKCRLFAVEAELVVANFIDYARTHHGTFDAVIFFASLEHMLIEERIESLRLAWQMLRPSGYLILIEAPNRLWKHDSHTSSLPFFFWLPPELALRYIEYSPRSELVRLLTPPSDQTLQELWRWGLGVSFHEFDLALGPAVRNAVCSSMGAFLRRRSPFRHIGWHITGDAKFSRSLQLAAPDVPAPWFEPYLNLAIKRS